MIRKAKIAGARKQYTPEYTFPNCGEGELDVAVSEKTMKVLIILLAITETLSQSCKEGSVVNDHLGQRRVCRGGKLSVPCRVRKEWNGMLPGERFRFVSALKKASAQQDYKSLVTKHTKQFDSIHNSRQFLAWHRWYLLQIENILRKVDPIVTVPYWDWSLWSGAPWLDQIMSFWSDAPWGFGSNGGRDGCVYSGEFGKDKWSLTNGGCLKRNFNGNPPDCIAVHKSLRTLAHKFTKFESTLRDTLHNNMHCRIGGKGGTMCSKQSANAPEFLLHHAFTDKLWSDWQKKETRYKNAYFPGIIYLYGLASLSIAEIDAIPRQKFTRLSSLEFDLFMAKKRREQRTKRTRKCRASNPSKSCLKNAKLNAQDNKLGFKVEDVIEAIERKKKKRDEVINNKQG
ncbi:hypothetical protein OS493_000830 [Desmophyllum pertusum]|uniref:Tyrosinase copper-binding domain-containing protein n=1 Tax=Desmophyllum pertusum TaxID=174260 RepID=A0A9W9ZU34_9CNID|nr:hypothetical protein OS493_000830 [Desmophyllum pertusum]